MMGNPITVKWWRSVATKDDGYWYIPVGYHELCLDNRKVRLLVCNPNSLGDNVTLDLPHIKTVEQVCRLYFSLTGKELP